LVYPHYWVVANFGASFPLHLEVIMSFYYVPQKTFNFELLVVVPFEKLKVESQISLFKTTMIHNVSEILKKNGKCATI
jgi:hypothetical protein